MFSSFFPSNFLSLLHKKRWYLLFLFDNFIIVELFGTNNFELMILRPNASAMWADFPCRKSFCPFWSGTAFGRVGVWPLALMFGLLCPQKLYEYGKFKWLSAISAQTKQLRDPWEAIWSVEWPKMRNFAGRSPTIQRGSSKKKKGPSLQAIAP